MSKAKRIVLMALATMAFATSAFAAVPSGYDDWVNVEKVTNWRVSNYDEDVHIEKVTVSEVRNGGYDDNNQPGPSITSEELDEMFRGN